MFLEQYSPLHWPQKLVRARQELKISLRKLLETHVCDWCIN
jgi:hypothetical protein